MRSSPVGSAGMLTREEFERFQNAFRMTWTEPATLAQQVLAPQPPAHFPHHVNVQHPTHLVYPASVPPAGQNFPTAHHAMLTPQPMMMPASQPGTFLGPSIDPRILYQPPPLLSHVGFPSHVPVAQPIPTLMPTATPAVFPQAPPPTVEHVLSTTNPPMPSVHSGDPHMPTAQRLPTPASFHQMSGCHPGHPFVQIASGNPTQAAAQMPTPNSVQYQQP